MDWKAISIFEARKWFELLVYNSVVGHTTFFEYFELKPTPVPESIRLSNIESSYQDKYGKLHIFSLATYNELLLIAQLYDDSYCTSFTNSNLPDRRVKVINLPSLKVKVYCSPERRVSLHRQG